MIHAISMTYFLLCLMSTDKKSILNQINILVEIMSDIQWNHDFSNPQFLKHPYILNQKSFGLGFDSL